MSAPLLASVKQQRYVRRLLLSCQARGLSTGLALDPMRLEWITTQEAGAAIARLKRKLAVVEAARFPQGVR